MDPIVNEVRTGNPMQVGDYLITPQTRLFKIQFPGKHGGIIWNRPKAVIVKTTDGQERILPVRDVTRIAIWAMLAGGLVGAMFIGMLNHKK